MRGLRRTEVGWRLLGAVVAVGTKHDFGGGVEANELQGRLVHTIILQWADPLGASRNDYDLFLVNANGTVLASSTASSAASC